MKLNVSKIKQRRWGYRTSFIDHSKGKPPLHEDVSAGSLGTDFKLSSYPPLEPAWIFICHASLTSRILGCQMCSVLRSSVPFSTTTSVWEQKSNKRQSNNLNFLADILCHECHGRPCGSCDLCQHGKQAHNLKVKAELIRQTHVHFSMRTDTTSCHNDLTSRHINEIVDKLKRYQRSL